MFDLEVATDIQNGTHFKFLTKESFLEPIDCGLNSQFYSFFNPFLSLQMGF